MPEQRVHPARGRCADALAKREREPPIAPTARDVGKHIGLMVKPIEEIWTWRDDFLPDVEASGLALHGISGKARH